jgi:hypothetical protein
MRSIQASLVMILVVCVSVEALAQCPCVGTTNRSLAFASTDVAQIPGPGLDGFGDFTIEAWFKYPNFVTFGNASVRKPNAANSGDLYELYVRGTGVVGCEVTGLLYESPAPVTSTGAWTHAAFVRQGGSAALYVNGQSIAGFNLSAAQLPASTTPVSISSTGSQSMNFSIDEVRIWNVARTQAAIQSTMNTALVNASTIPNLVGYWRFDELPVAGVEPQVFLDSSATGNNGVLGSSTAIESIDPSRNSADVPALLAYCSAQGNANSTAASLLVNGIGSTGNGPFFVTLPVGGALALSWSDTANMPLILANGTLMPGCLNLGPTIGILDLVLGTVGILFNGLTPPGNLFFSLGASGTASQSSAIPASIPAGTQLADIQGAVLQPSGFLKLTAAFRLTT